MRNCYIFKKNGLKQGLMCLALLGFMAFGSTSLRAQLAAGTYTVGTGGDYATLTEAFDVIKADSILGDVVFELLGTYADDNLEINGVSFPFNVTIRPAADATAAIFSGRTWHTGGSANIIFDGRKGGTGEPAMIFRQQDNTARAGIRGQGAGFFRIRYCDILSNAQHGLEFTFGTNVEVDHCTITRFQDGFYQGSRTEYFRTLFWNDTITFTNNKCFGWNADPLTDEYTGIIMIYSNSDFVNADVWNISNNTIVLDKPANAKFVSGIRHNQANRGVPGDIFNYYHNSVVVRGDHNVDSANSTSQAFWRGISAADTLPSYELNVVNNLFINEVTNSGVGAGLHSAIWSGSDFDFRYGKDSSNYDYNNYYSADGPLIGIGNADDIADLAALQAAFTDGKEANTTDVLPVFTDPTGEELVIEVSAEKTWHLGTPIAEVPTDINDSTRSTTAPIKGAWERINQLTSIEEGSVTGIFSVYPNPASDRVWIELDDANKQGDIAITLMDMTGRVLREVNTRNNGGLFLQPVQISDLPLGTYLLQVEMGEEVTYAKIQKVL